MNKIKIAKQKRIASGLSWRFRAIELLAGGVGEGKFWEDLTQDERVHWFKAFIEASLEQQLEQQND